MFIQIVFTETKKNRKKNKKQPLIHAQNTNTYVHIIAHITHGKTLSDNFLEQNPILVLICKILTMKRI